MPFPGPGHFSRSSVLSAMFAGLLHSFVDEASGGDGGSGGGGAGRIGGGAGAGRIRGGGRGRFGGRIVGRGGGRGRARGGLLSCEGRLRHKLGVQNFQLKRARQRESMIARVVAPTMAEDVSQIFGLSVEEPRGQDQKELIIGNSKVTLTKRAKGHHDFYNKLDVGVVSHVDAQARAIADMLVSEVDACWSTNIFDEASFWIQKKEVLSYLSNHEAMDPRLRKKLQQKGRNAHMPVLNQNETLFTCAVDDADTPARLQVHDCDSPAQVLPVGNTATLYKRWRSWSALLTDGTGDKVTIIACCSL